MTSCHLSNKRSRAATLFVPSYLWVTRTSAKVGIKRSLKDIAKCTTWCPECTPLWASQRMAGLDLWPGWWGLDGNYVWMLDLYV